MRLGMKTGVLLLILVLFTAVRLNSEKKDSGPVPVTEIKIGSVAPARSPWDKALERVAREWESLSGGSIRIRIYPGSIAGGEFDMIRKMRLGVLQGVVLTNMGLTNIQDSVLVLNLPFLFNSEGEFRYVFDRLKPVFEGQIENSGFKVVTWTLVGWVHFFSKGPVVNPDDLKKYKIAVTEDSPDLEQVWKKMGYHAVPGERDLMIMLETGMVSAAYLPPLLAGSGQYFAIVPHMLSMPLAPLVGSFVLSNAIWEVIPENFRQPMLEAARREEEVIYREVMSLESEAIEAMRSRGLRINTPAPEDEAEWKKAASKAISELVGGPVSRDIYDLVSELVGEYRRLHED